MQQTGHAGQDGKLACALLLVQPSDLRELQTVNSYRIVRTQRPAEENSYSNITMKLILKRTVRDVNVVMYDCAICCTCSKCACYTFSMQKCSFLY